METLFFAYYRQHNLRIKVGRIFNAIGPRMHPNDRRVVSKLLSALKNEPITPYGDGSQSRSLCYVDDLIEAFVRLIDTPNDFVGPMNLGNPNKFTIRQLAETVIELTGARSELTFLLPPPDDPKQRQPDITRAKKLLGWEPKVVLEDGLRETIRWFQANLDSPVRK